MNYLLFPLIFLIINQQLFGQCQETQAMATLNGNDVRAVFRNGGDMFWDGISSQYNVPYSPNQPLTKNVTIAGGALWLGAYDGGGNLRLSAQTYRNHGNDYWAGPIDPSTGLGADCAAFDQIWTVKGNDVKAFVADYRDNGVLDNPIPNSILQWPGRYNPNSSIVMNSSVPSADLAPFFDSNADGIYNPYDGDYPIADPNHPTIIADEVLWMVFNDQGNGNTHTQSNSQGLKAEIQLTAYAFYCTGDDLINQTIFTHYKIMNREVTSFNNFRVGLWTDFDLGCIADDYWGTIPNLNTIYVYNSDNYDYCFGKGFDDDPPVQAHTILNKSLSSSIYTKNTQVGLIRDPSSLAIDYYRLLNGTWIDGSPLTIGGNGYNTSTSNPPTNFAFPDNPNLSTGWSMNSAGVSANDYRMLATINKDTLYSGETFDVYSAYSYHRNPDSSNLQNVNLMYQQIPIIQNFYDNGYDNGNCSHILPVPQIASNNTESTAHVFPNPAYNQLNVQLDEGEIESLELSTLLGQEIYKKEHLNTPSFQFSTKDLSQGIYLLTIKSKNKRWTQKVQISK